MSTAILGLTAGFITLSLILLMLLLKTRLAVGYKFVLIVLVTGFFWVQYHSLHRYMGWPTDEPLPEEFVLIASEVKEPNSKTGEPGEMLWWIRESHDLNIPPRVYRLPYTPEIHESSQQVIKEQGEGSQYVGKTSPSSSGAEGVSVDFEKISKSQRHKKSTQ